MTQIIVPKVTKEEVKQSIIALIKENDTEFQQLLLGYLSRTSLDIIPKKARKKRGLLKNTPVLPPKHTQVSYNELPFWKNNPTLKPFVLEGSGTSKETINELQSFFKSPDHQITDSWFDMLN